MPQKSVCLECSFVWYMMSLRCGSGVLVTGTLSPTRATKVQCRYRVSRHANCNRLTCQHALVDDAGAEEQNGVAVKSTAVGWDDNDIARNQVLGADRVHRSIPSAHFNYITAVHRVPQLGLVLKRISTQFESCGKKSFEFSFKRSTHFPRLNDGDDDAGG